MRKAALVAALVVAVVAVAVLVGCGTKVAGVPDTVASVNGQSISSGEYLGQISRRFGQDMLRNMIEQKIVLQWAKEEKVSPTDEQIDKQIETLKREGSYDDQVKYLGEDGLRNEVRAMQARINLARKTLTPTEEEIKQTYDAMKQRYVHPARKQVAIIINSKKSDVEEAAKKLKAGENLDQVSAQYSNRQFSMRGPIKIWVDDSQAGLPQELSQAAKKTKEGGVCKPFALTPPGSPTQYAVLKVLHDQPKANTPLSKVKSEVEDTLLFQKSQSDPDFVNALNERMKDAKVEVNIDQFKDLVYQFKNPPEPQMMMPQPSRAPQPAPKSAPK